MVNEKTEKLPKTDVITSGSSSRVLKCFPSSSNDLIT